ncbi:glycoside hydrolase family 18 protein [Suillus clintonianus]|uniref:glycoside hydrolase family 18 protein n=1 Tax=Suillus clintonianus TaxID=1904413 RepID=UPI001B886A54|nr:glycoside hydrolase family 18 protein [Suillus clintonianus]KAG2135820.1 glycoside hydrolase family 18 protein [Suillus clintonianus]
MLSTIILPLLSLSAAVSANPLAARSTTPVVATWYAGWHATEGFPLSSVSWDKYNTLYYSFAETTQNVTSLSLADSDGEMLPQFVSEAHAHGVEAHIAVGGWTGSVWFSSNLATAENRTAFVQTVADFVLQYNLDGIQFDWESPNNQGIGCNTISVNDTANFLAFLQELRQNPVAAKLTLSAAVGLSPFFDATGSPSTDATGFAKVLDYVAVMNYDVWGPWFSTVGPNAPLNDTCAASANQQGSAVSAVKSWTDAGMPVNQIVLGVASYGHSFNVSPSNTFTSDAKNLAAYPAYNASNQPLGDAWDNTGYVDVCGVYEGSGGTFNFWGLIDNGFLTEDGTPADGIYYRYDNCSQTPYVYNETSQVMISFDNVKSFAAKGEYIKNTGLRGFSMWEAGGDYKDMLLNSIIDAFEYR